TDLQLTSDDMLVLFHDEAISENVCRLVQRNAASAPATRPLVRSLTLAQLRAYRAKRDPDRRRFPDQDASRTPLADLYARETSMDPYAIPTLADLFAFAAAYAGDIGREAGKTDEQRSAAAKVRFDLELKRVPFHPEFIGDSFDGHAPALLEQRLVHEVRAAGVVDRTLVRGFDHRCVRAVRRLEPRLRAGGLTPAPAPAEPVRVARAADAHRYCPEFQSLDLGLVQECHAQGIEVVPWTVNNCDGWLRLLDWGVDGITTDYPDRLADFLRARGIPF